MRVLTFYWVVMFSWADLLYFEYYLGFSCRLYANVIIFENIVQRDYFCRLKIIDIIALLFLLKKIRDAHEPIFKQLYRVTNKSTITITTLLIFLNSLLSSTISRINIFYSPFKSAHPITLTWMSTVHKMLRIHRCNLGFSFCVFFC